MKTYKVELRPEARRDLDDIFDLIAADSPERAYGFVERIYDACQSLAQLPFRGPARDKIAPGLRILPFRRRVVIAYRVEGDLVEILNVFYDGRDYESLLRDQNRR